MNSTNYELRETEEQQQLRETFSHCRGNDRALICQCCCTGSKVISSCWEAGYAEINGERVRARKCGNCAYIQFWKIRKPKCDKPTKSQERSIQRIKNFFERDGIQEWKVEPTNYGVVWVSVRTEGNVYSQRGGFFKVPRNGGRVECVTSYALFTKEDHFTRMVNY